MVFQVSLLLVHKRALDWIKLFVATTGCVLLLHFTYIFVFSLVKYLLNILHIIRYFDNNYTKLIV